jgi:hypothetical protein
MLGRLGWWALGTAGRVPPVAWFAILWVTLALVAHYGHHYAGNHSFRLGWGGAILTGLGLASVAIATWWFTAERPRRHL